MSRRKLLQRAEVKDALAKIRWGEHEYRTGRTRVIHSLADLRRMDPLFRVVGICRTGIRDGSIKHDRDIDGPSVIKK